MDDRPIDGRCGELGGEYSSLRSSLRSSLLPIPDVEATRAVLTRGVLDRIEGRGASNSGIGSSYVEYLSLYE